MEYDELEYQRDIALIEAEMHERLMAEWQEWEEENEKKRKPARIEIFAPFIHKKNEDTINVEST